MLQKLFNYFHPDHKSELQELQELPEPVSKVARFKPLTLFDNYMFAKSYIRFLLRRLDESRKQNRILQDEIVTLKKQITPTHYK